MPVLNAGSRDLVVVEHHTGYLQLYVVDAGGLAVLSQEHSACQQECLHQQS